MSRPMTRTFHSSPTRPPTSGRQCSPRGFNNSSSSRLWVPYAKGLDSPRPHISNLAAFIPPRSHNIPVELPSVRLVSSPSCHKGASAQTLRKARKQSPIAQASPEWSTLPRTGYRPGSKITARQIKTSGRFRMPLHRPNNTSENFCSRVPKPRVVTYLPPPPLKPSRGLQEPVDDKQHTRDDSGPEDSSTCIIDLKLASRSELSHSPAHLSANADIVRSIVQVRGSHKASLPSLG